MLAVADLSRVCLILVSQIETLNEACRYSHGLAAREEEGTEDDEHLNHLLGLNLMMREERFGVPGTCVRGQPKWVTMPA